MRPATNRRLFLAWTVAALVCTPVISSCTNSQQAQEPPAAAGSTIQMPDLKGKAFEYQVADYRLRLTFLGPNSVHWEYLAAPGGLTGKNSTETIDSMPIRNDIVLIAWKEADGTQVLDVLDLGRNVIHTNFVTATGERHSAQANMQPVQAPNR